MIEGVIGFLLGAVSVAGVAGVMLHRLDRRPREVRVVELVEVGPVEVWRDGELVYAGPDRRASRVEDSEDYRWPDGRRAGEVDEADQVVDPVEAVRSFESETQREAARWVAEGLDPWGDR